MSRPVFAPVSYTHLLAYLQRVSGQFSLAESKVCKLGGFLQLFRRRQGACSRDDGIGQRHLFAETQVDVYKRQKCPSPLPLVSLSQWRIKSPSLVWVSKLPRNPYSATLSETEHHILMCRRQLRPCSRVSWISLLLSGFSSNILAYIEIDLNKNPETILPIPKNCNSRQN